MTFARFKLPLVIALASWPTIASGQTEEATDTPFIEVSTNVSVVSDYRFRGISLSDRDPALQGGIDFSTAPGFFFGAWASTVADTGGSNIELDLYGGYANAIAGIDYSVSVVGYVYPGGEDVNYVELFANAEKSIDDATFKLEFAYIPEQNNFEDDNFYVSTGVDVALPKVPLTLNLSAGRESSVGFRKWDWLAGVSWSYENLTLSAAYVDTNYDDVSEAGRLGRAGAVVSLTAEF